MALTEHYVTSTGTDTWANSTNSATPCSLTTALANCTSGDRVNVKAGTYSRTTTSDALTQTPTQAGWCIIEGYNSTPGDLSGARTNGGALTGTNFPVLTFTSGSLTLKSYTLMRGFNVSASSKNGPAVTANNRSWITDCIIENTTSNGSACALSASNGTRVENCDCAATGSSTKGGVWVQGASILMDSRLKCTNGAAVIIEDGQNACIEGCVFFASAKGIGYTASTSVASFVHCYQCTFQGCTTVYSGPNANLTGLPGFKGCMITDATDGLKSGYSGTGNLVVCRSGNRTRDLTNGDTGYGDSPIYRAVTTDTGGPETDYIDYANGDFRLIAASPGAAVGLPPYSDIGALQRQENYPATTDVKNTVVYGQNSEYTGSYTAASGGGPIMGGMVVR